jgi:hypothetical protein
MVVNQKSHFISTGSQTRSVSLNRAAYSLTRAVFGALSLAAPISTQKIAPNTNPPPQEHNLENVTYLKLVRDVRVKDTS